MTADDEGGGSGREDRSQAGLDEAWTLRRLPLGFRWMDRELLQDVQQEAWRRFLARLRRCVVVGGRVQETHPSRYDVLRACRAVANGFVKGSVRFHPGIEEAPAHDGDPVREAERREAIGIFWDAFRRLRSTQQLVLVLRYGVGRGAARCVAELKTIESIAKYLGISADTVAERIAKALDAMSREIGRRAPGRKSRLFRDLGMLPDGD
jgi:DNA-directed RNA polymerase specialized sigma24 family protein